MGSDILQNVDELPLKGGGFAGKKFHLRFAEKPHAHIGALNPGQQATLSSQVAAGIGCLLAGLSRGAFESGKRKAAPAE